jgi:hypothetical protein
VSEVYLDTRTANHLAALVSEVEILKGRIREHDTGHIHTTINTLENRITELRKSGSEKPQEEQEEPTRQQNY